MFGEGWKQGGKEVNGRRKGVGRKRGRMFEEGWLGE